MPQTLAQLVRAKYPDAYGDMNDQQLEAAVKAKFPGVYDDVPTTPASTKGQIAPGSTFSEKIGNAASMLKDVAIGAGKGLGSTVAGIGEDMVNAGMIPGQVPAAFSPDFRNPIFNKIDQATTATNTAQRVGKVGEKLGEVAALGIPSGRAAVEAIPSTTRAGAKFAEVAAAANKLPVDLSEPGNVALRIADLAQRGGGTNFGPPPVRQFLQWATNPNKPPMNYEVAKDFASNISRLSSKDLASIPPVIQREIANLRVALNKAVGEAAAQAGKGQEYADAMTEYAKAMRLRENIDAAWDGAKRAAPYLTAGGATYWLGSKIASLFGSD